MNTDNSKVILIADSHKTFLKSFKDLLLEIDYSEKYTILEASTINELTILLKTLIPDIIFIDYYFDSHQSIDILKDILIQKSNIVIIGLSFYNEEEYVTRMIRAGAKGYLLKDSDNQNILNDILRHPNDGFFFSIELNAKPQLYEKSNNSNCSNNFMYNF